MSLPRRHNRLVPVALQPWEPTFARAGARQRLPAARPVCEETLKLKKSHGRCDGCDRQFFCRYDGHGGTEAVSFVKEELPKLLGKEWRPNGRERLKQACDKADQALPEHLQKGQKEGEATISNSEYVIGRLRLCCS